MKTIKESIIKIYNEVLVQMNIDTDTDESKESMARDSGLDSLGFVNLIIGIEEEFEINLDSVLIKLRQTKRLHEVIDIVSQVINNKDVNP